MSHCSEHAHTQLGFQYHLARGSVIPAILLTTDYWVIILGELI